MNYKYIDSAGKLAAHLHSLKDAGRDMIALDLEGEFNLHRYGEKLCLIQIYDGKDAAIIDPFKISIVHIKRFLENRSILKIMYSASGDRAFLYKNYGIDLLSILDLQEAVGLLGYEKTGLKSVLKEILNIDGGKSKNKFQRYNWNRRPIDSRAIEYAIEDVLYLLELKDKLIPKIIQKGLLEKYILKNLQVQNKPHVYSKKPKLLESGRFRSFKTEQQRVFEKLFSIRERYAKNINLPPNSVFPNELLFEITEVQTAVTDIEFGKRVSVKVKNKIIEEINKVLN